MSSLTSTVSSLCRTVLPEPVLAKLRGNGNSVRQRFIYTPKEKLGLWLHLRRGGSYVEWYARRLDGFAADVRIESLEPRDEKERHRLDYLSSGYHDRDLLVGLGLMPHHDLHEIGVGHGRSAHFFVDYLEPGRYSGNDISKERLRMAAEHFALRGLDKKKPLLIVNRDNTFDWMDGRKVDYVWANSVFGHMPPEDVETIVSNLWKIMRDDAVFYFTVRGRQADTARKRLSAKDWTRDNDFWAALGGRHGCTIAPCGFELPQDFVPQDCRLLKLTQG